MAFRIMGLVMNHGPADLKKWAVLMALADFADDDGVCYPSADTLAVRSRLGRASVFRALAGLVKDNAIQRQRRGCATGRTSNRYRINVLRLLNAARAEHVARGVHPDFDPFPEEVAAGVPVLPGGSSLSETNPVSSGDEPRLPLRREPINKPINEPRARSRGQGRPKAPPAASPLRSGGGGAAAVDDVDLSTLSPWQCSCIREGKTVLIDGRVIAAGSAAMDRLDHALRLRRGDGEEGAMSGGKL